MELFKKIYDGESIVDISRDIDEAFNPNFNTLAKNIPQDKYGIQLGEFVVTIQYNINTDNET